MFGRVSDAVLGAMVPAIVWIAFGLPRIGSRMLIGALIVALVVVVFDDLMHQVGPVPQDTLPDSEVAPQPSAGPPSPTPDTSVPWLQMNRETLQAATRQSGSNALSGEAAPLDLSRYQRVQPGSRQAQCPRCGAFDVTTAASKLTCAACGSVSEITTSTWPDVRLDPRARRAR